MRTASLLLSVFTFVILSGIGYTQEQKPLAFPPRPLRQYSRLDRIEAAIMTKTVAPCAALLTLIASVPILLAQGGVQAVISGPVGPSPYDVVRGWHKPFAEPGSAFGGNSGVFAESPNRIFIAQRGETRLPSPVPPEFAGYAGSIGINAQF